MADGCTLIGEYEGSGYREPPALIRRSDGQVIQLTPLLYAVAEAADGNRSCDEIADVVSDKVGKRVSADNVRQLLDEKLRPLGLVVGPDGSQPDIEKPDPLLALRWRVPIIPEHRSKAIASLFKPLFLPPVVLAALVAFVAFDVWLFGTHGIARGFHDAMYEPALILIVFAAVIVGGAFHEFGHAAGCAYGGAKPGAMGAGVYVAWPAFYTDVTDAYSLNRAGRLRTDLAGVYFNVLFILALAGLYFATGFEPLLIVVVVQHFEMVHQLLPLLRLDGYYVVADLTGVPDLFARIGPILSSSLPWRRADDRVRQLKPWVRVVVTLWVALIVPLLLFQLVTVLLHLPRIAATAWDSLGKQADQVGKFADGDILGGLAGVLQIVALSLPLLGLAATFWRLGRRSLQWSFRSTADRPVLRVVAVGAWLLLAGLLAYTWLPNGDYEPVSSRERGTVAEVVRAYEPSRLREGKPSLVPAERDATAAAEETESDDRPSASTSTTVAERDQDDDDDGDGVTRRTTSTTSHRHRDTTGTTDASG